MNLDTTKAAAEHELLFKKLGEAEVCLLNI
jgi:hypothetical protein